MPARTHTRSPHTATGGVEARLPWWAVALPTIAFAVLLLLIMGSGDAHAATETPAVGRLLQRITDLITR
ncbi:MULTISPECIES: hypothetical protein [unclassified Streptomyces]|uniref:hypothetical protein n=1 Tax=unclassified Streptomyces TaxID=2593676 RepID=UPI0036E65783